MTFFHKKAPERTKKERKTGSFIHQGVNCPDAEHTGYRENGNNAETAGEICDLTYHMLVLMALQGITPEELEAILTERHGKAGNLKTFKKVDRNS